MQPIEKNVYITEQQKKLNVISTYDVAVAGGGIAGIAAALAASRQGKKVLLFERMFALGGMATLGLVTIYLPLCDGNGRQVSFGIAEELLKLSIKFGWETDYPDTWLADKKEHGSQRYMVRYNAQVFAILAEQLLREENVDILYGTTLCDVVVHEQKIEFLIIENKDGRSAIKAKSVVDATGDADACVFAGEQTALYQAGNPLAAWYYETKGGKTKLNMIGTSGVIPENINMEIPKHITSPKISGIDARGTSEMMFCSHEEAFKDFHAKGNVSEKHSLAAIATIPQLRMTRRLKGAYELQDSQCHMFFEDSIGMISDWRKSGPVYEIPFSTLYGKVKNLITAGRCISVSDAMWDISRSIPACAITGQAAGTAASESDDFASLDIKGLQKKLQTQGVILHETDLTK